MCVCARASIPVNNSCPGGRRGSSSTEQVVTPLLRLFDSPAFHSQVFQRLGGGGDTRILSPGMTPKQPLPGIVLHDPLHGRQACPQIILISPGGWSNKSPVGAIFVPFPPKTGTNLGHPRPPQSLNEPPQVLQNGATLNQTSPVDSFFSPRSELLQSSRGRAYRSALFFRITPGRVMPPFRVLAFFYPACSYRVFLRSLACCSFYSATPVSTSISASNNSSE